MTSGNDSASRRRRIVVVGSINMDLAVRTARLPRPGETVQGHSFRQIPGGKGANQAVAAARLGAAVVMIGRVGDDSYGTMLRDGLANDNIDVSHVLTTAGTSTGIAVIGVEDSGQNSITVIPGANACLTPNDVLAAESAFNGADVVLLQFEIPLATVVAAIELARRHSVKIIVDPAPAQSPIPADIFQADVICPNESEAEILCGMPILSPADAISAAEQIFAKGSTLSLVTLGSQGVAVCRGPESCQVVSPFVVEAVDSTAAGDAFAAALGLAIAEGMDGMAAVRFASAAGALATTRHGAQPSMPARDEVEGLLATQRLNA